MKNVPKTKVQINLHSKLLLILLKFRIAENSSEKQIIPLFAVDINICSLCHKQDFLIVTSTLNLN